jgi:hypothetical protein
MGYVTMNFFEGSGKDIAYQLDKCSLSTISPRIIRYCAEMYVTMIRKPERGILA